MDISTRVLRAMIALDDLRHFSLAAERCNVTQSALSQMIARLERDIDLRLIDRDRRHVAITDAGARFVAMARRVIMELEEVDADLSDEVSRRKGRVSINALPSLAAHWLSPLIVRYRSAHPGVLIELMDTDPDSGLELLRRRRVDFSMTARGAGLPGLKSRLLFKERFVFVCHRTHALAGRSRISVAQLKGCAYIRLMRAGTIAEHLEYALRAVELSYTGMEVAQIGTLAGLIANNLGVSIVPANARRYFDPAQIAVVPISDPDLHRPIHLVWRANHVFSPAAQGFADLITATAATQKG